MVICANLSDEKLIEEIYNAAREYSKLIGNSYLIIGKNRKTNYFWFQCYFQKKHFMHLLGIDSKTLSAEKFYEKCQLHNKNNTTGISILDCQPSRNHSRININEKTSCCAQILRLEDAKYMKVGFKSKISQHVDFSFGYGNIATLGFKKSGETSFPITLISKGIDEFVTEKHKIVVVLRKTYSNSKYNEVFVEAKQGLFLELYPEFPDELKLLCA